MKAECRNCSGHVEFEEDYLNGEVPCPHCGQAMMLIDMPTAPPPPLPQVVAQAAKAQLLPGCPDCGHLVSGRAETCPGCGRPLKKRRGVFFYTAAVVGSLILLCLIASGVLMTLGMTIAGISLVRGPADPASALHASPIETATAKRQPIQLSADQKREGLEFFGALRASDDKFEKMSWYSVPYQKYLNLSRVTLYFGKEADGKAILRLQIRYCGKRWLFINSARIRVGENVFVVRPKDVKRHHFDGGDVWETMDEYGSDYEAMLAAILREGKFSIRCEGSEHIDDREVDGEEVRDLRGVLLAYVANGGKWFEEIPSR